MHKGSSWAWESAQVTSDQLPSAPTATTRITRTHALPTAITGLAGSLAASSSVQARGSMVASMDAQDTGDMETGVTVATGDMMAVASTDMARLEAGSITAMATTASTAAIITAEAASTVVATSTVAVADSTAVVAATAAVTGKFQS